MTLTEAHIDYIRKDLHFRGILEDSLEDELIDHICSLTEGRMAQGDRFIEAYHESIRAFGTEEQLQQLQVKTIFYIHNNHRIMFKNYFKVAFRNLVKHRFYAAINIIGLSIGVACSLIIALYVYHETSFDKFHTKAERIYRIKNHGFLGGNEFRYATAPAPLAPTLLDEVPEVEEAVRFRSRGPELVSTPEMTESFKETGVIYVDSGFFRLFTFPLVEGSPATALNVPMGLAISKSAAEKYYPNQSAIGKTLILDGDSEYTIRAVFQDMPENSHLQFDILLSMASRKSEANNNMWVSNNFFTYLLLRKSVDPEVVNEKIQRLLEKYLGPQIEEFTGDTYDKFKENGNFMNLSLQPLDKVYLYSDFIFDIGQMGNATYIKLFSAIALFIIVLACINFMNLSTARSASRAREVGVRKVLGSYRSHLIRQFLSESILMCLIAVILGVGLVVVLLPLFNDLADLNLELPFNSLTFYLLLGTGAILLGTVAGIYPAIFLSSFRPVNTLKGKLVRGAGSNYVRSGLVIFQFFIGILLIIGTYAIQKQLNYMQHKKIGFDKEQTILIYDAYMLGDQREAFKEEIEQLAAVRSSSYSSFIPINGYARSDNTYWEEGKNPTEDNIVNMQMWTVDDDYLPTLGLQLLQGRNFKHDFPSDSSAVLLNEEAAKLFHIEDKLEKRIETFAFNSTTGESIPDQFDKFHVIGVVKNFHFESMKKSIGPLAMQLGRSTGVLSVKLATNNFADNVTQIKNVWNKFGSSYPFSYQFLDEEFGNMYRSETKLATIFTIFTGLAIFIGCLGLFALASFMAEQRTKEIGIRKVLGASVQGIVMLLSKQFSKLVFISFLLAVPVAWWGIDQWLAEYNYKITIGWEMFAIAGVIALTIALFTVLYQSIKAANSNPVKSLRSE